MILIAEYRLSEIKNFKNLEYGETLDTNSLKTFDTYPRAAYLFCV